MKIFRSFILKCSGVLASLALIGVAAANNSSCFYFYYQPKMPEGEKNLIKK